MLRFVARVAEFMLVEMLLRWAFRAVAAVLVVLMLAWGLKAHAQTAVGAQMGTVVGIAYAAPTPAQTGYGYSNNYAAQERCQTHNRAVIGGAIGGIVGLLAARHSYNGQWVATAAGTAIGGAVGNGMDHRAAAQCENGGQQPASAGQQVIVKFADGQTIAVFSHQPFAIGQQVWLIGNGELVAANGGSR